MLAKAGKTFYFSTEQIATPVPSHLLQACKDKNSITNGT